MTLTSLGRAWAASQSATDACFWKHFVSIIPALSWRNKTALLEVKSLASAARGLHQIQMEQGFRK